MTDEQDDNIANAGEQLSTLRTESEALIALTSRLGVTITRTFAKGMIEGRRFEDVLQSIGKSIINIGLRAGLKPLESAFQSGLSSLLSGNLFSTASTPLNILPSARGNVFSQGAITPFAMGGVVGGPTLFPMRSGAGLMGERGAEAIMPLQRGPDGRLGVRAGAGAAPQITVNISTPDADSFRRSEAQVAGALARAVARGRRAN